MDSDDHATLDSVQAAACFLSTVAAIGRGVNLIPELRIRVYDRYAQKVIGPHSKYRCAIFSIIRELPSPVRLEKIQRRSVEH